MKKFQVFLSSVSKELHIVRRQLIEKMFRTNQFFPIAMENFTADDNTITMLYNYLKSSDIYVLILKNSVGTPIGVTNALTLEKISEKSEGIKEALEKFLSDTSKEISDITFTMVEYILAKGLGIPILAFVYKSEDELTISNRIEAFCGSSFSNAAMTWTDNKELTNCVYDSLNTFVKSKESSKLFGWVRLSEESLYRNSTKAGIINIVNGGNYFKQFKKRLKDANKLDLFFTTGRGFIVNNQALLGEFIASGGTIRLLCGFPNHDFLCDVASAEYVKYGKRNDIHEEFLQVITTLGHIYSNALMLRKKSNIKGPMGSIYVGNSATLFRSSIVICHYKNNNLWGWLTITLPPEKSVDMLSVELEYQSDKSEDNNLLLISKNHFNNVWQTAENNSQVFSIDETSDFSALNKKCSKTSGSALDNREYWEEKWRIAKASQRHRSGNRILIEVAAQHPLKDGLYPDIEFSARLDFAFQLYNNLHEKNIEVEIYVPGSLHLDFERIPDDCSLSSAGIDYLKNKGIPENCLHGDDLNNRYDRKRKWSGVFNSGDECYIASQYFNEKHSQFSNLISVCSPNQLMRKTLFYINQGIIPMIYTVPVNKMFHNFIYELYNAVPDVLSNDNSYQEADSAQAKRSREERMPGFKRE